MTDKNWKARELEILRLLAQGLTNSEIAARLHLSQETIRWYNTRFLFSNIEFFEHFFKSFLIFTYIIIKHQSPITKFI